MNKYFSGNAIDDFEVGWYSKHLSALHEPPLPPGTDDPELYVMRFVYLRTFHRPVIVRAELSGLPQIVCKMGSGMGGYEPGVLLRNERYQLTDNEAATIRQQTERAGFWEASTYDAGGGVGLDGAQWIFEGVRFGRYHVGVRWCPKEGPWRDLGETMLEMARLVGTVY